MEERSKKAFDFASDSTKQLTTLATGIVTLMITFSKDIVGGKPGLWPRLILAVAWFIYLLSIGFGIQTLLALTGTLEPVGPQAQTCKASIRGANVTIPSACQIVTFLIATLLTVVFGTWLDLS